MRQVNLDDTTVKYIRDTEKVYDFKFSKDFLNFTSLFLKLNDQSKQQKFSKLVSSSMQSCYSKLSKNKPHIDSSEDLKGRQPPNWRR